MKLVKIALVCLTGLTLAASKCDDKKATPAAAQEPVQAPAETADQVAPAPEATAPAADATTPAPLQPEAGSEGASDSAPDTEGN